MGASQTVRVPVTPVWAARPGPLHVSWRDNRYFRRNSMDIHLSPKPRRSHPQAGRGNLDEAVRDLAREEAQRVVEAAQGLANEQSRARRPR